MEDTSMAFIKTNNLIVLFQKFMDSYSLLVLCALN